MKKVYVWLDSSVVIEVPDDTDIDSVEGHDEIRMRCKAAFINSLNEGLFDISVDEKGDSK